MDGEALGNGVDGSKMQVWEETRLAGRPFAEIH